MAKQSNNSTPTIKGIIYQFLIALDKCFELQEGQSVYIETYGDVSVLGESSEQIESKFYNSYLTELDHNVWKTLNNWMKDDFNLDKFNSLILFTTQKIKTNSPWYGWNGKKKEEKLAILLKIQSRFRAKNKQAEETKAFFDFIFDDLKVNRLIRILNKFFIDQNAIDDVKYYKQIREKWSKGISKNRADQFIRSMFGFILKPEIIARDWEISYDNFTSEVEILTQRFIDTTREFPQKLKLDNLKYNEYLNNTFVEKIKEINYEAVVIEAITDFAQTRELIMQEFRISPSIYKSLEGYGEDIKRKHQAGYRKASRNCLSETKISQSQNFYDEITGMNNNTFHIFNSTPQYFYTGMIHMLADEKDEIVWLLKKNEI